jgi:hypothetical protein
MFVEIRGIDDFKKALGYVATYYSYDGLAELYDIYEDQDPDGVIDMEEVNARWAEYEDGEDAALDYGYNNVKDFMAGYEGFVLGLENGNYLVEQV